MGVDTICLNVIFGVNKPECGSVATPYRFSVLKCGQLNYYIQDYEGAIAGHRAYDGIHIRDAKEEIACRGNTDL